MICIKKLQEIIKLTYCFAELVFQNISNIVNIIPKFHTPNTLHRYTGLSVNNIIAVITMELMQQTTTT